jgi:hypothetical protein
LPPRRVLLVIKFVVVSGVFVGAEVTRSDQGLCGSIGNPITVEGESLAASQLVVSHSQTAPAVGEETMMDQKPKAVGIAALIAAAD